MLPTGFSPGYTSPSLLNRRERQQQQQQRPDVKFGWNPLAPDQPEVFSKDDKKVKEKLAREARQDAAKKKSEWLVRKDQLQAREPGFQNHIRRLTLAVDRIDQQIRSEERPEEIERLKQEKDALDAERKNWQDQLAALAEKESISRREYVTAKNKANELGQVWGKTTKELKQEEEKKTKAAEAKKAEEARKQSPIVVNNYLDGKKTETPSADAKAGNAGKTSETSAKTTDAKTDAKEVKAEDQIVTRDKFVTRRVLEESDRIAADLQNHFVSKGLLDYASPGKIWGVGSMLGYDVKLKEEVAPEVEDLTKGIREKLEQSLKTRKGIYAKLGAFERNKDGSIKGEYNPKDRYGNDVEAKKYAKTVIANTAIKIAREAVEYPEDLTKHKEQKKAHEELKTYLETKAAEVRENRRSTVNMRMGAGLIALSRIAPLMNKALTNPLIRPLVDFAKSMPVIGTMGRMGVSVIRQGSFAGLLLGSGFLLYGGGVKFNKYVTQAGGMKALLQKRLNEADDALYGVPGAITEFTASALGLALKTPDHARKLDGLLGNKPSQLAGHVHKKTRDTVSSWWSSGKVEEPLKELPGKTEGAKTTEKAIEKALNEGTASETHKRSPSAKVFKDIGVDPASEQSAAKPAQPKVVSQAAAQPKQPPAAQQPEYMRFVKPGLPTVALGAALIPSGWALALVPVVGFPIGLAMLAAGCWTMGRGLGMKWFM